MKNREWQVIEALNWASSFLGKEGNAPELLLAHAFRCSRTELFLKLRETCPQPVFESFRHNIVQHKEGVPVQYLIGEEQFYSRSFLVNEAVLIPRPETEELVQLLLRKIENRFQKQEVIVGCDIGTGSGAIAITLALEERRLQMTATDLSENALSVAKHNAKRLNATNVTFLQGDLLQPLIERQQRFDVIVSNPPYIESDVIAELDVTVREYEPHLALDGGKDGYDLYRRMIEQLPEIMKDRVIVGFEVGVGQSDTVASLLHEKFPAAIVEITYDINGKDRIVTAEIGF